MSKRFGFKSNIARNVAANNQSVNNSNLMESMIEHSKGEEFEKKDQDHIDFNDFSAIGSNSVFMNDSRLTRFKGFNATKGGSPNLGIAAPLFVPVENNFRQSRFGDSGIGGE